jgi:hypothetical protein
LSESDALIYEQRCLREVDLLLRAGGFLAMERYAARQLASTALQGEHPDTKIVVTTRDKDGKEFEDSFPLWSGGYEPSNSRDPRAPRNAALIIAVNAAGL